MKKKILSLILLTFATQALPKTAATFEDLKVIASLKNRLAQNKEVKEAEVLLINHFKIPMIIGVYNTVLKKVERVVAHINPDNAYKIPQDFFEKYINHKNNKKVVLGCSYGNEIQSINTSYFKPVWQGITLDNEDLIKLNNLLAQGQGLWLSMMLLGNNPIICINEPQSNQVIFLASSDVKKIFNEEMLKTPEIYRLLWGEK